MPKLTKKLALSTMEDMLLKYVIETMSDTISSQTINLGDETNHLDKIIFRTNHVFIFNETEITVLKNIANKLKEKE